MDIVTQMVLALSQQVREIREDQIRHGQSLQALLKSREDKPMSLVQSWHPLLKTVATAGLKYAVAIAMIDYLLKGGDALTFAQTLLKLL